MKQLFTFFCLLALPFTIFSQANKILFDASSAQMAGNADWIADADTWNIGFPAPGSAVPGAGNESNPARYPTPAQSGVTSTTAETYWKGGLSAWAVSMVKLGYTAETLPYNGFITYNVSTNPQDLSNYKVFVVCEPNIKFTTDEKNAIVSWVQAGGGLFMIGNHNGSDRNNDGWDAPRIWNDLMTTNTVQANPFGISFDLTSFSETTSNRANLPTNKILNGTQASVTQMKYSSGTSMTINTTHNTTVKGLIWRTNRTKNNFNIVLAQANFGTGRVVAVGDSSPPDDGTGDSNDVLYNGFTGEVSGNHKKMFLNATIWLAGNAGALADEPATRVEEEEEMVVSEPNIYPNPTSDVFAIAIPENWSKTQIQILDLQGKAVLSESNFEGKVFEFAVNDWLSGIYILKMNDAENSFEGKMEVTKQ